MRLRAAILIGLMAVIIGGCGSGGGSGYTEDEIAQHLGVYYEGADNLYDTPAGTCIVTEVMTSEDEVESAENGELSEAVATTPDGTAGVAFGGLTSVSPDTCASYAEEDLANLPKP
jgi:hypothetical protein